jgi:hypothetical protein
MPWATTTHTMTVTATSRPNGGYPAPATRAFGRWGHPLGCGRIAEATGRGGSAGRVKPNQYGRWPPTFPPGP